MNAGAEQNMFLLAYLMIHRRHKDTSILYSLYGTHIYTNIHNQ